MVAQQTATITINSLPAYHPPGSAIYVAGSFNGWNPQDEKFKMQYNNGVYTISLKLDKGSYEYKITRGGWDKVECKKNGVGMGNRILEIEGNDTIELNIEEWQDRFPAKPGISTASKNVKIVDTAFWIPQLKRTRRIWIYLPEGYTASTKKYPVLYMQDGQNVFDDATSFSGEWGVDECLDSVNEKQCIVVAVDHGGNKRLTEYNPYDSDRFGKGEGDMYVDFLVKTLKPFIDKKYRTIKTKKNTFVAGSSMGGLISMYAVLKYPKVFGGAGIFSPSFWVAPPIFDEIKRKGRSVNSAIYFYAGKQEGENMVTDMLKVFEAMADKSKSKMTTVIRDDGKHTEAAWKKEFYGALSWMLRAQSL
ncbi:MAG TPA: alpha/beta hydrolase-fold protein [Chitinophagaceae bacterium]